MNCYAELIMVITRARTKLKVVFPDTARFSGATYNNSKLNACKIMRLYIATLATLLNSCNRHGSWTCLKSSPGSGSAWVVGKVFAEICACRPAAASFPRRSVEGDPVKSASVVASARKQADPLASLRRRGIQERSPILSAAKLEFASALSPWPRRADRVTGRFGRSFTGR